MFPVLARDRAMIWDASTKRWLFVATTISESHAEATNELLYETHHVVQSSSSLFQYL